MLIHEGTIIDRQFFGLANAEEKRVVDEDTIYHWASITKTFTGIAIMQLRDHGRLKLDDSVIKYVPELSEVPQSVRVHERYHDTTSIKS